MRIKKKVLQKIVSVFASLLLLVNSFSPFLLIAPSFSQVKAEDPTITQTQDPTPTDTISPTATADPTLVPTETATPTPTVTPEPLPLQAPSQWTFEKVELNKEYVDPQNNQIKLTFTKLPDPSGNIKIEEITLTEDQIKQTGSLSDKAYDITSDMKDGDFTYNLSLPIPESSKGKPVEIKFAEEISNIGSAEKVDNALTKTDTSVSIVSLDHMTIFVVVYDAVPSVTNINYPSLGFQATQTSEFGDYIHLGGSDRLLNSVTVTMSNWAKYSDYSTDVLYSGNNTSWSHPITINIYSAELKLDGTPKTKLGTITQNITIPWRPAGDPTCPDTGYGAGFAWKSPSGTCYNGLAFNAVFDMSSLNLILPDDIIVGVAYNTNTWGYSPIGLSGPYESLNVAVPENQPLTIGSDDSVDEVFWNTVTKTSYTDGGAAGFGIFRKDTAWVPYGTVAFKIETIDTTPACDASSFDTFTLGSVNGQGGWTVTGPFDQAIVKNSYGYTGFGCKTLRISDSVTSGSFGDQIFANPQSNSAGETSATAGTFSVGTRQNHFETQFDIASTIPTAQQAGMHISISPDRGDGSRMSYLRIEDGVFGLDVYFDDVQQTSPCTPSGCANFVETQIATGLDRTIPHTIKISMDFVEGQSNDVVKVWIDGVLKIIGTSWEDYYRFDPEASAEQSPRIVKTILFRASGTATAGDSGKGFLFDNVSLSSTTPDTTAPAVPTLVSPADGASVKPAGLILDWSDSVDPEGSNPVKYYYKSSYISTVGANNALTSPIYTSGILTTSQINASGSADHIYYWQVRACDSLNNCSNWSGPWEVIIDRTNPANPGTPVASVTSPTNQTTITWNWTAATDLISGIKNYFWNLWMGAEKKDSGTTTDTFKTLNLLSYGDGIFTFDVQSEDNAGNVSGVMTSAATTTDTVAPNVPTLNSPIDGFVTKGVAFSQTWNSVVGAVLYEYESCNVDPGDIGGVCSSVRYLSTYTGTTKNVGAGQPDSHFWWRVRAKDAAGNWSGRSVAREIIIDNTAPGKPTITSPTAEQYFKTSPILNQWGVITDLSGIKQYTVEYIYDDGHTFSGAPYRYTTTNSRNHSPALTEQGGATIRVRAEDNAGNIGEWSNPIHYVYDATAPTVTSVSSDGAIYNLASGNPTIQVTFNENISNTPSIEIFSPVGTPQSVSNCGDTDVKTFCFDYNLLSEETIHTIKISGGQDVAGNTMAVSDSHTFKVDRVAPTITTVDTTTADGSYTIGQIIDFNLTFNEIVNVSGTPEFLVSAGPGRKAIYNSGSGTNTLTFKYVVGSSDGTPSYLFANDGSLNLNGGSIKDVNENDTNLTLPSKDIFLVSHSIFIDTNVPVITAHGNMTVEADSVSGATVNYTSPIVTDNHDSDFSALCGPLSGTVFAFGTTSVTCNASDTAGNNASPTSFTVTVVDTTVPTAPVVTSPSHALSTWSSDRTIDVSWSASDFSGISGYSYQWSTSPTTNPDTVSEGINTTTTSGNRATSQSIYFHIKTYDGAGNWSGVTHYGPFWVDANNPTGAWTTPLDGDYLRSTVNLEVSSNDVGSGVKHVVFKIKKTGGSFTTISTDITSPYQGLLDTTTKTDGTYVLRAQIVDNSNRSVNKDINIIIDNTAPIFFSKTLFTGWHNTNQTSTFTYSDTNGVVSGNNPTCDITTEGTNQTCSVTPNVCDTAGNCNTTLVTSNGANIDFTVPSSEITTPSNSGSGSTKYMNSWDGSIEGTALDALSGVNGVKISIQNGTGQYFNGTNFVDSGTEILRDAIYVEGNWQYNELTSPAEDSYTVRSHAIDNATNMESTYTLTIILDKTIPEVAISLNPAVADASNGWYKTQPEVTLTATDTNKDIVEYQWNSQTGTWTTYSGPFKPGNEGEHILYYRARDLANNYSGVGIKNIKWDQTELTDGPLNVSVSPNPTSGTTSVVKWDAAKDNIGIDRYEIKWSLKNGDKSYTESVGSNIREKTINNLIEGDWTIEVKAFDWSGKSKSASTDLTVDRTGPSNPTLSIFGTSVGSVTLSWTKIDGANSYIIWYGTNPGSYQYGANVGDTQGYTVQGLGTGSYYFIVKAVDPSGNQSGNSNEVSSGTIIGTPGVNENTPAQGFAEEVLGEATESAKLTPTGSVLGTNKENGKKNPWWWPWALMLVLPFGWFGYKKWKIRNN
ncbi:MAG: HYR domain-containing protein [Patescibacteria group bacterium]|jgi:hypothetical protein